MRAPILLSMDSLMDWRAVAARLDEMGRGSRSRLAELLDMDRSQLARQLRTRKFPALDQAATIEQFLTGSPSGDVHVPASRAEAQTVPLYGYAAGSEGDRIAMNEGRVLDWIPLPRGMRLRGEFFFVQMVGGSMEPRIWSGERKLVQRGVSPGRMQDAVIEFHDGTAVLKTYEREKDGVIFARQYNSEKELRYEGTKVKALHAVLSL